MASSLVASISGIVVRIVKVRVGGEIFGLELVVEVVELLVVEVVAAQVDIVGVGDDVLGRELVGIRDR